MQHVSMPKVIIQCIYNSQCTVNWFKKLREHDWWWSDIGTAYMMNLNDSHIQSYVKGKWLMVIRWRQYDELQWLTYRHSSTLRVHDGRWSDRDSMTNFNDSHTGIATLREHDGWWSDRDSMTNFNDSHTGIAMLRDNDWWWSDRESMANFNDSHTGIAILREHDWCWSDRESMTELQWLTYRHLAMLKEHDC